MNPLTEQFGDPIDVYTRAQALDDGELIDMTAWASAKTGFLGGFTCPVALTRALWAVIDTDSRPAHKQPAGQSTRGRAHDVLWMTSLGLRQVLTRHLDRVTFRMFLTNGRQKKCRIHARIDGDGVTIGFPEDF